MSGRPEITTSVNHPLIRTILVYSPFVTLIYWGWPVFVFIIYGSCTAWWSLYEL